MYNDLAVLLKEHTTGVANINNSLLDLDAGEINIKYRDDIFTCHSAWLYWPYKLHWIKNDQVRYEFYNLEQDSGESNDLSASNSEKVKSMIIELEAWLKSVINSLNGNDYK